MKFSGKVGNGNDPDHRLDAGIVFRIHHSWEIRKVVNGLSFILIREMAALVRRALAEVYTVPVFLVIIRPHRSTTYVDVPYRYRRSSVVCRSVCRSVTIVSPAKTAEPIDIPFGLWSLVGPMKHVLGEAHTGTNWRTRLNRQCAAAMRTFCQITLTTCYYYSNMTTVKLILGGLHSTQ